MYAVRCSVLRVVVAARTQAAASWEHLSRTLQRQGRQATSQDAALNENKSEKVSTQAGSRSSRSARRKTKLHSWSANTQPSVAAQLKRFGSYTLTESSLAL